MKRDMDLIRAMLLEVEKSTSPGGCQIKLPDHSREELYYNAQLAQEAGLIDARFLPNSAEFHVLRLTNSPAKNATPNPASTTSGPASIPPPWAASCPRTRSTL
jgi:hypothetical protein